MSPDCNSVLRALARTVVVVAALAGCGRAAPPAESASPRHDRVGSPADTATPATRGGVRRPVDEVGYTHSAEGIGKVIDLAMELEKHRFAENRQLLGVADHHVFAGAISPHDDYRYAARVFVHVYPHIRARHVVAVGVAHKARDFPHVEGKLVLDSFDAWHGPYGDVRISPLRDDLLKGLSEEDRVVCDDLQAVEHSVEGMVPFLQHFNREAEIVSVLVPYMSWERLRELAEKTASVLGRAMDERGLVLGKDVAILISSDSVHYGDLGWGGKSFAAFGVGQEGYDRGVERDRRLIGDYLAGPIALDRLEKLYRSLVKEDFHEYEISWCGRFSIPFGVALLHLLPRPDGRPPVRGIPLSYGTTLDPGPFDPGVSGLGFTAEANLRHWVGFAAIGYY
jgi:AmmeMemoRadiSam system protein B